MIKQIQLIFIFGNKVNVRIEAEFITRGKCTFSLTVPWDAPSVVEGYPGQQPRNQTSQQ